ncbi:MAG TPA: RecX family transcriptional regulator [Stellaceae bacterium]|nr:RecX family transcriptional regulator [Stellaceae bacterium]
MADPSSGPSAETLLKAALDYLAHYASSGENLRRVLLRRAEKQGAAPAEAGPVIATIIERCRSSGLVNDAAYASQQAESLARRGHSRHAIRFRLMQKGVDPAVTEEALARASGDGAGELAAACALVRRRRLGPLRPAPSRAELRDRDLGILARAGFGLDLAKRVLAAPDEAALEQLSREREE